MKKTTAKIFSLLFAVMLLVTTLSVGAVPASARSSSEVLLCVAFDGEGELLDACTGVPIKAASGNLVDATDLIILSPSFYQGNGCLYYAIYGDTKYEILPTSDTESDLPFSIWYSTELTDAAYFDCAKAEKNEECSLVAYSSDAEIIDLFVRVHGYNVSGDWYELEAGYGSPEGLDILFPAAIVNESNELVAFFALGDDTALVVSTCEPDPWNILSDDDDETETTSEDDETSESDDNPEDISEPTSEPTSVPTRVNPTGDDDDDGDTESTVEIIMIVIGFAVIALLLGFLGAKKKKIRSKFAVENTDTPPDEGDDFPPTEPEDFGPTSPPTEPEDFGHTTPPEETDEEVKVYLVGINGPFIGHEFLISESEIIIGRAVDTTIRFPEDTVGVSRYHCKIFFYQGVLTIVDLGSSSGTYLTDRGLIAPDSLIALTDGDRIDLGSTRNSFEIRMR